MMMAFDDLFDAGLSTILHVSMEMCRESKAGREASPMRFGLKNEKISDNFPFPLAKKHQNNA
ncbi:hypothetical protein [Rhizobium etli]|uniref:hypothetical protein n=1 Tax=Rhizobium etli TaxID=29449 RepID=UPI0007B60D07|nr:hypothetical protein [Rhizobium etli]